MNLNEVVNLLKEIVDHCPDLNGYDFLITPSKIPGSTVEGYEVHITGKFSETTKKYLNDIAVKEKLATTQHPNSIMIYKMKSNEFNKAQK